jgi:hypothetical protein
VFELLNSFEICSDSLFHSFHLFFENLPSYLFGSLADHGEVIEDELLDCLAGCHVIDCDVEGRFSFSSNCSSDVAVGVRRVRGRGMRIKRISGVVEEGSL